MTLSIKIGSSLMWSSWAWVISKASGRYWDGDLVVVDEADIGNKGDDVEYDDDSVDDDDGLNPISETPFSMLCNTPWPISKSIWNIWFVSFCRKIEQEVFEDMFCFFTSADLSDSSSLPSDEKLGRVPFILTVICIVKSSVATY